MRGRKPLPSNVVRLRGNPGKRRLNDSEPRPVSKVPPDCPACLGAFVVASLFGWQRSDGLRRFRTAYCAVPRKNGKSTLSAGIALYLLVADGRAGRRDLFRCHHPRSGAHRIR
jgi:Phage Terminase